VKKKSRRLLRKSMKRRAGSYTRRVRRSTKPLKRDGKKVSRKVKQKRSRKLRRGQKLIRVRLSDGSYAEIPEGLKNVADYFGIKVKDSQPISTVRRKVEKEYARRQTRIERLIPRRLRKSTRRSGKRK
jgi:hypothetical protein